MIPQLRDNGCSNSGDLEKKIPWTHNYIHRDTITNTILASRVYQIESHRNESHLNMTKPIDFELPGPLSTGDKPNTNRLFHFP